MGDSNLCFGSRGKFRARVAGDAADGDVIQWEVTKRGDREGKQQDAQEGGDVVLSGKVILGEDQQQEENEGRNKKKKNKKNEKKNGGGSRRKIQIAFETGEVSFFRFFLCDPNFFLFGLLEFFWKAVSGWWQEAAFFLLQFRALISFILNFLFLFLYIARSW